MTDPRTPVLVECPTMMDAASIARLEAMAYRFGRSYDSYLVMDLDRKYFWSSGGSAVLGFVLQGSHAVAGAGSWHPPFTHPPPARDPGSVVTHPGRRHKALS